MQDYWFIQLNCPKSSNNLPNTIKTPNQVPFQTCVYEIMTVENIIYKFSSVKLVLTLKTKNNLISVQEFFLHTEKVQVFAPKPERAPDLLNCCSILLS